MSYADEIEALKTIGRFRQFTPLAGRSGCKIRRDSISMINLTSNDYLGLAGDKKLHDLFYANLGEDGFLDNYGLGAASSRLLTGDRPVSHELEQLIASSYGAEASLLFNSGYHANIGILPALAKKGDLILSDKLNHASLIDGSRLSRATFKRYNHLDYDHLLFLLEKHRQDYNRTIIVTESVFSMDGDVADLSKLCQLKKRYDCLLYVDEAHSVGLYGKSGLGICEVDRVLGGIDLLVGTFGKSYGATGAFLVCSKELKEYLTNFSRSLIFTTGLPPVVLSWNYFVFKKVLEMHDRREKVKNLSNMLRDELARVGLPAPGSTNIIPVLIGDDERCQFLAEKLQGDGFLIFAIRPPTVPQNSARFRLSITADMEWEYIADLPGRIKTYLEER